MAATPYYVAEAFRNGSSARIAGGNFRTDGVSLYTYSQVIAHRDENGAIVEDYREWPNKWPFNSTTTRRHVRAYEAVVSWNGTVPQLCGAPAQRRGRLVS